MGRVHVRRERLEREDRDRAAAAVDPLLPERRDVVGVEGVVGPQRACGRSAGSASGLVLSPTTPVTKGRSGAGSVAGRVAAWKTRPRAVGVVAEADVEEAAERPHARAGVDLRPLGVDARDLRAAGLQRPRDAPHVGERQPVARAERRRVASGGRPAARSRASSRWSIPRLSANEIVVDGAVGPRSPGRCRARPPSGGRDERRRRRGGRASRPGHRVEQVVDELEGGKGELAHLPWAVSFVIASTTTVAPPCVAASNATSTFSLGLGGWSTVAEYMAATPWTKPSSGESTTWPAEPVALDAEEAVRLGEDWLVDRIGGLHARGPTSDRHDDEDAAGLAWRTMPFAS